MRAGQQFVSTKCQVRGSSSLWGPLLHHATAFTATAAHIPTVIARVGREGVVTRPDCRLRACHQCHQDEKRGERQLSVHRKSTHIKQIMMLDLTNDEAHALAKYLRQAIDRDPYQLAPPYNSWE